MTQELSMIERDLKLAEVFTPAAPINQLNLFAGRVQQREAVLNAILQRGRHAVLYGERGVGKTSLASVLREYLEDLGRSVIAPRINCDGADTYSTIWHKALDALRVTEATRGLGFNQAGQPSIKKLLNEEQKINTHRVRQILEELADLAMVVIILDEFDRVRPQVRAQFADTVKMMSDQSVDATLVIVGVGDTVSSLIGDHESIERSIAQVRVPRMSNDELNDIVEGGLRLVGMSASVSAMNRITTLSQGLPHFTHLVSLYSAQDANDKGAKIVNVSNVDVGIREAVDKAQETITRMHHQAVTSARVDALYRQVALACALGRTDERGLFSASAVRGPMSIIMEKDYEIPAFARHLNEFCSEKRGPILERIGRRRNYRYRFRNPLLPAHIIMKGLAEGLVTIDAVEHMLGNGVGSSRAVKAMED